MSKQEPSGEVPDVTVGGSQGIQVGSGNTQYNSWVPKKLLDPVALRDLNPHVAVARLQQLSHDDLVDFFARAAPGDVSEIVKVLAEADPAKVVTALADVSRRKATELISALNLRKEDSGRDHILVGLPEAAEAIARTAASLRWTDAGLMDANLFGFVRRYKNGRVFWSREFGTRTTMGAIDDCCEAGDLAWGFPVSDQSVAQTSPFGTEGILQRFQGGTVYSSERGTFLVAAGECYAQEGSSGGWLGFPVGETKWNTFHQRSQEFEGGIIYSWGAPKEYAVRQEVADLLPGDRSWFPVSKEISAVSSCGTAGRFQRFESQQGSVVYPTTAYWGYARNRGRGPSAVGWQVWDYYSNLGAEKSWLGFPVTSFQPVPGFQFFERGTIYWKSGSDPIAIRKATQDFLTENRFLPGPLGFPVTEEQPMGTDGADRIQFFKGGAVTLRDGKYEVWERSDRQPASPAESAQDPEWTGRRPPRKRPRDILPPPSPYGS